MFLNKSRLTVLYYFCSFMIFMCFGASIKLEPEYLPCTYRYELPPSASPMPIWGQFKPLPNLSLVNNLYPCVHTYTIDRYRPRELIIQGFRSKSASKSSALKNLLYLDYHRSKYKCTMQHHDHYVSQLYRLLSSRTNFATLYAYRSGSYQVFTLK